MKVQTNLCIGNYVLPCDVYTTYWDPSIPNPRPLSPYPCPISWVECSLLCDPISIVEAVEESDRHDPFEGKSRAYREENMELYIEIMLWFPPLPTNSSDEVVEDLLAPRLTKGAIHMSRGMLQQAIAIPMRVITTNSRKALRLLDIPLLVWA